MEEINTNELNILVYSEVVNLGTEFIGEVCYSGEYGEQVYNKPMEKGGTVISGLLYERYPNDTLAYYSFYENGIPHGVTVEFYRNGQLKEYKYMEKGTIDGKNILWFESGVVKLIAENKYGFRLHYLEWDESGNLIREKQEPTTFEKKMIEKYDLES